MTGRGSQRKGKAGEIELRDILREQGYNVERGFSQNYGELPDLYGLQNIHIEVKRVEKLNIFAAMAQSERDSEIFLDGYPCVFFRRNREPWRVCMNLYDWLLLYHAWLDSSK